jgi:type IV pilus assembly protein PilY1
MAAITDILLRASSGTAVSVLATSSEGEGTLVQAYFKPQLTTGTQEIKWLGYLQSLWVDSLGRTREDTPPQGTNPGLVLAHDKIVEFFFDSASGESSFRRYDVDENGDKAFNDTNSNGIQDAGEDYIYTTQTMDNLQPVWEAGSRLHQRDASTRTILTYMDKDNDGSLDVDDPATVGVDEGESVNFNVSNYSSIQPWLGVKDGAAWAYLGDTYDNRAKNLIRFIRGDEDGYEGTPTLRYRLLSGYNWKLGDIVHSTPVTIGRPMDNYNVIYGDQTYQNYYDRYKNREQVVYVGGNDGMMHAFYMGKYVAGDNSATTPADPTDSASVAEAMEEVYFEKAAGTTETWGDELWAYIPQAILPHLKWLADTSYTHVYSVDLKPKLVDAKIFVGNDDDPTTGKHPNGWGTVLIGGLNMGGKAIDVTDQFPDFPSGAGTDSTRTFTSCYFAIDVTDPHDPVLLWERTYTNVGLTTSLPTVAKVGDSWFAIFGSGPTDYQGDSSQKASIYVVDLATGALRRRHECAEDLAFMSSPITVDVSLNYNVDVGYIGETFKSGSTNLGMMYVIRVPKTSDEDGNWQTATSGDAYNADPTSWSIYRMLNVGGPITAPAGASFDSLNNLWVYFGTGRYYSTADKSDTSQQYFLGVKDPYYNSAMYSSESDATTKSYIWTSWDFLDSTDINVNTDLSVTNYGGGTTWGTLVDGARAKDGWWMGLKEADGSWVGERVLNKPTVLGGIVFDTTFTPNSDVCGFGGSSNLLGLYYETGTAYYKPVFAGDSGTTTVSSGGTTKTQVEKKASVGIGRGSSVAIHVGKQDGVTGYVQQSTGIVEALELSPAFKVRSGFIYWRER